MNIHESAEDYLERILMIQQRKGVVYSIDIVHELNFSKPSVSVAMKRLRENGYIQMDADSAIILLPTGGDRPAHLRPAPASDRVFAPVRGVPGERRHRRL